MLHAFRPAHFANVNQTFNAFSQFDNHSFGLNFFDHTFDDAAFRAVCNELTERVAIQLRGEMYNLFNRIQFGVPNLTLLDTSVAGYRINPNFGQIGATNNSPRNMQLMLRYQF